MNIPYSFHPNLILRTPKEHLNLSTEERILIENVFSNVAFMEALFLASPVLHKEVLKYMQGNVKAEKEIRKLKFSLAKYQLRMRSRCTPFGLFSGCGIVKWADAPTEIEINKLQPGCVRL